MKLSRILTYFPNSTTLPTRASQNTTAAIEDTSLHTRKLDDREYSDGCWGPTRPEQKAIWSMCVLAFVALLCFSAWWTWRQREKIRDAKAEIARKKDTITKLREDILRLSSTEKLQKDLKEATAKLAGERRKVQEPESARESAQPSWQPPEDQLVRHGVGEQPSTGMSGDSRIPIGNTGRSATAGNRAPIGLPRFDHSRQERERAAGIDQQPDPQPS